MPMYDYGCQSCGHNAIDVLARMDERELPCPECQGVMVRQWTASNVIGDEIDVEIKHGLCNEDGSPKRFTSRQELKREAIRRGWTNVVEHKPGRESDKSKFTQRWV